MSSGRGLLDRLLGRGPGAARRALALGVAALLASAALAWVAWGGGAGEVDEEAEDAAASAASPTAPSGSVTPVPADEARDRRDGIVLLVPRGDRVTEVRGALRVVRADRAVTMTLDGLPDGPVRQVHADVVDAVEASYARARLEEPVPASVDGRDGLRTVGTVRREDGTELLVQLTTVGGGGRVWGVSVFAAADREPEDLAGWLGAVLRSVRLGR